MGIVYVVAALAVVPALLGAFHLLSRPPRVTSQPPPPAPAPDEVLGLSGGTGCGVAEEAESWLRSQSSS